MNTHPQSDSGSYAAIFAWSLFSLTIVAAAYRHKHSPKSLAPAIPITGAPNPPSPEPSQIKPLWQLEKQAIIDALQIFNGDKAQAAQSLGIAKTTLYRKLKVYRITIGTISRLKSPE